MNTTKIIITNSLPTGTAFAVLYEDYTENVFIPSKVAGPAHLSVGDVVDALLVPNMQQPEKTPWLAARLVVSPATPVAPDLRARIVAHLTEYDATVQELAAALVESESAIEDELNALARDGYLLSETVYSLRGAT
jgi:uncharacterized protein YqfA (UPF0365 family)